MITGEEPLLPQTDLRYINNTDPSPTQGLFGGLTLKGHLIIEFTKSILSTINNETVVSLSLAEVIVNEAEVVANEVIKKFNEKH